MSRKEPLFPAARVLLALLQPVLALILLAAGPGSDARQLALLHATKATKSFRLQREPTTTTAVEAEAKEASKPGRGEKEPETAIPPGILAAPVAGCFPTFASPKAPPAAPLSHRACAAPPTGPPPVA